MSMDIEREAKEASIAIWGEKVSPHEYSSFGDRLRAQGHLDVKSSATEDLLLALCRRVREEALEECRAEIQRQRHEFSLTVYQANKYANKVYDALRAKGRKGA